MAVNGDRSDDESERLEGRRSTLVNHVCRRCGATSKAQAIGPTSERRDTIGF
jgi:hypothetical protein